MTTLHTLKDLTPDWLTGILREQGILTTGQVRSIKLGGTTHQASLNYFLNVKYSADAPKTAPKTFFFKLSRPERLPLTASEVEYYTKIVSKTPHKITPTCYSAEFDEATGAYHILLEDVSATHSGLSLGYPPTPEHAHQMVRTLARLHAHWWANPTLNTVSDLPTEAVIRRYANFCLAGITPMFEFLGNRITSEQQNLITELAHALPRWMIARTQQQPNHLTLIHGDSHSANFLMPKAAGEPYLIDRQPFEWSLTCWLGVNDLTYLMVHFWYPAYRQRIETAVLQTYHQELQAQGINHYAGEELWEDYRLCAIQSLYVPLAWCAEGNVEATAWIWYRQLMYTLDALDQLGSAELLRQRL